MTQGSDEMRNLCGIIARDNDIINIEQQVNGSVIKLIDEQGRICQGSLCFIIMSSSSGLKA